MQFAQWSLTTVFPQIIEKQMEIKCEKHGEISMKLIAPDLVSWLIILIVSFEEHKKKRTCVLF